MNSSSTDLSILTIDQGNSSAKAVVWSGGVPVDSIRMSQPAIEELLPLLERYDIRGCAFCSVAHNDAKFLETLRRLVDGRLVVLTPTLPLPIGISYASRRTLGSDRVAAAIGAVSLFPGEALLVVDAGTAVTLDFVSADGVFLGGNIAPGMSLRFESLRQATSRLPLVEAEGPLPEFGEDTLTAIRCGVVRGMTAEIADAYSLAAERFGCRRVVMAGADAPMLAPMLEKRGISVATDPYLVGRGLEKIYTEDISQD
ncbi:MAG: type III pantothenate kinase [Bacteroides sp.]|nr:type III pantothenate kinase [Bacteroides sp.]